MMKKKQRKTGRRSAAPERKSAAMRSVKGAIFALVITITAVLIFALIVKEASISSEVIGAVNQVIKMGSIFAAALIASKGLEKQRFFAGAMAGAIYVVLGYLTFSLIEGRFGDILMMFADLAMGAAIGMLTAAIFGKLAVSKQLKA